MNSDKKDGGKLPDGWVLCKSKSIPGRKYYFHKKTGRSSWSQPQAEVEHDKSKKKSKKQKEKQEKIQKEESARKYLKRKSDSNTETPKKKQKQATPVHTPEKLNSSIKKTPVKPLPSRSSNSSGKSSANSRLAKLRAQLASEALHESLDSTPKPKAPRISPKVIPQTETHHKVPELKSPISEAKCPTTHSPGSDSLQSIPSPSQFLAANKILSSMKAQLPEEYNNKSVQKDTFADIEQGICNQTADYPFMKHPATPPQFSEASKLMSAIKSKLSYKMKDEPVVPVKTFSSAKERLETLRNDLSNEAINEMEDCLDDIVFPEEAMEVDCKEIKSPPPTPVIQYEPPPKIPNHSTGNETEDVVLVVDTNIFIHELDVIKNVLNSHIKGYKEQPTLLVPWRVINELDRLKDNNNGNGAICKRARAAMDYLYKSLPENNRIKGQSLRDANSHIHPCELPDDEILNCALQQAGRGKSVILLSNDKNLCNKAVVNGLRCIGLSELKPLLESKPQVAPDPDRAHTVLRHRDTMHQLLANILENEMRAKYNNLWKHVLFKPPPWTLADVLQCLLKHWVAVFNEVFPRIEHLITDLKNSLASIERKDPKSLSQSEVTNFKELCLDIARKCLIIPEYMELAKMTVERLEKRDPRPELPVIEAFEGIWTVFSSYCAKLATGLGVEHSIEDKLPTDDPLDVITSKLPMFSNQVNYLTMAIKGALSIDPSDPSLDEHVSRLEMVFKDSVNLISRDSRQIHTHSLRIFCIKCRNMLEEAHTKFAQLKELLDTCKERVASK
ncbi:transcriptional protein SWT1 [Cydia fagiglandana]|uniref:transcriptional protein SWT1 n=1 Tax=Cydia fagiglandana TaxID=1458189 RepID=UPI002FEDEC3F